jgi:K+-sensing histidine kinase KdpD
MTMPPEVRVSNLARLKAPLGNAVFDRGYRGATDKDGSGNGLYVAQLVARQHGSQLWVENAPVEGGTRVTFGAHFLVKG